MKKLLALLLLMASLDAVAAEMGRLFFTPAEREKLNVLRANARSVDLTELATPDAAPVVAVPSDVSVQGYVKRSDGKKNTVWVNGQPVQEDSSGAGVEVGRLHGNSNQVPLTINNSGKALNLKAGQVYSPSTDTVTEVITPSRNKREKKSISTDEDDIAPANSIKNEVRESEQ